MSEPNEKFYAAIGKAAIVVVVLAYPIWLLIKLMGLAVLAYVCRGGC